MEDVNEARLVRDACLALSGQSRPRNITSCKPQLHLCIQLHLFLRHYVHRIGLGSHHAMSSKNATFHRTQGFLFQVQKSLRGSYRLQNMQDLTATSGVKSWTCSLHLKLPLTPNTRCKTTVRRQVGLRYRYRLTFPRSNELDFKAVPLDRHFR